MARKDTDPKKITRGLFKGAMGALAGKTEDQADATLVTVHADQLVAVCLLALPELASQAEAVDTAKPIVATK